MDELRKRVIKGLECVIYPNMFCGDCSYFIRNENDHDTGWCNRNAIYKDALTLLKAQELRVLTLDEAKAYVENEKDYYTQKPPIYVEYYQPKDYWVRWLTVELLRGWLSDDRITDYNKANPMGYRFWTYYPTDKQRKEVEWE